VVVTDDIGMGAVRDMFDRPETVERMMNAGTDIIDICAYGTDTAGALRIASFIEAGVKEGRIDGKALDKSQERIAKLLESAPQYDVEALAPEVFEAHARIAPLHDAAMQGAGTWQPKS
jgi:beta-glucosidase-like glycosyl hydrolase